MNDKFSLSYYRQSLEQSLDLADELALTAIAAEHEFFEKGVRDFALDKDHHIEQTLKKLLTELTPNIPVLGEESFEPQRILPNKFWIIDPIDGTVNFSRELPLFGVTIALISDGQAIAAGISFPKLRERYIAIKNQGATLNGDSIKVAPTQKIEDAIIALGDFSTGEEAIVKHQITHYLLQHYAGRCLRIRMVGSAALQLAWLAAGRVDVSITLSNKPWDVQAGALLVNEASGQVFDEDGVAHNLNSRFTFASNNHLKSQLVTALQQRKQYIHLDSRLSEGNLD